MTECAVSWCDLPIRACGYCNAHYLRTISGADMDKPIRVMIRGRLCGIPECGRKYKARGYCGTHLWRLDNGIDINRPVRIVDPDRGCSIADCEREHNGRGYCSLHLGRLADGVPMDGPAKYYDIEVDPGLAGAHARVRKLWGSASQYLCIASCGEFARHWAYDGTDATEFFGNPRPSDPECVKRTHYSRYPEFYMPMCVSCHATRDKGRAAEELREYREWKHRTGMTLKDLESAA